MLGKFLHSSLLRPEVSVVMCGRSVTVVTPISVFFIMSPVCKFRNHDSNPAPSWSGSQLRLSPLQLVSHHPGPTCLPALPSLIYGGIYLAGLMVKIPKIIAKMRFSSKNAKKIIKYLESYLYSLQIFK